MPVRCQILLTDLLTTAVDGPGHGRISHRPKTPMSRHIRQLRTNLDDPNLATDQTAALATRGHGDGQARIGPSDGPDPLDAIGPVLAGDFARGAIPPVPRS
jgi:hypothetical protein